MGTHRNFRSRFWSCLQLACERSLAKAPGLKASLMEAWQAKSRSVGSVRGRFAAVRSQELVSIQPVTVLALH